MKRTETSKPHGKASDEMLPEYKFNYSKARPNRFASRMEKEGVTVTLDVDVSEVFTNSESVNAVLRALIKTMPQTKRKKRAKDQSSDHVSG